MKKMFRLMAMAVVVLALAACSKSATPEGAAGAFLKSYQKGDYAALVDQMHFSKEITKEQKDQFVQLLQEKSAPEIEKKGGIAAYEVGEVVVAENGESAKVNYTLTYGDGTSKQDKVNLVQVDGKWMIDGGK
jgi:Spy/CpxP family protein refolding chaperone